MAIKAIIMASIMMLAGIEQGLHNVIVGGKVCNQLGEEKYVQNNDTGAAYDVTVKVEFFQPGSGSSVSQKVVSVPAGGKTYLGCSAGLNAGVTYTYTVIGESKK